MTTTRVLFFTLELAMANVACMEIFVKCTSHFCLDYSSVQQEYFDFEIPSVLWTKRVSKFESKLTNTDNMFCKYLV